MTEQLSSEASEICPKVAFVHQDADIKDAVLIMCERGVGSVLVHDDDEMVCGIITSTDIVRKFTLLVVEDKLQRKVLTFMTRPVAFAKLDSLKSDIERLYFEKKLRHYPVIQGDVPHIDNVFGVISITDLFEGFFKSSRHPKEKIETEEKQVPLFVLTSNDHFSDKHKKVFSNLNFSVSVIEEVSSFFNKNLSDPPCLLFDMDGYSKTELSEMIFLTKKYRGRLVMLSSNPSMVALFRQYLDKTRQAIVFKPIDVSYVKWFFQRDK